MRIYAYCVSVDPHRTTPYLHREVKARAARAGMSLSDFLLREVERIVEAPPVDEVLSRIAVRRRPRLPETPAEAIRSERDAR